MSGRETLKRNGDRPGPGLIFREKRPTVKALQGLLAKRNECAHPGNYEPSINDTLGYLDEMMKRIEALPK
jgi:hypothetical protein